MVEDRSVRDVALLGIGQTPWASTGSAQFARPGLSRRCGPPWTTPSVDAPQMLFVGNMLSGQLCAPGESRRADRRPCRTARHRGVQGRGGLRLRCAARCAWPIWPWPAAQCDVAVACGVEKMTDGRVRSRPPLRWPTAADAEYEGEHGLSFVALNALLMQRYMHEYGYHHEDFAGFTINAHHNAVDQSQRHVSAARSRAEQFERGAHWSPRPISLLDSSGIGDGAAAVVVAPTRSGAQAGRRPVRMVRRRPPPPMRWPCMTAAIRWSCRRASRRQRPMPRRASAPEDIDFFELHDAFTIMSALSLEACGFAPRGQGVALAHGRGRSRCRARIPISTMGGLKARGHPVGATGLYQVVEAVQQLRGAGGREPDCTGCRLGMTQNIGGSGANVVTHILERMTECRRSTS